MWGLEGRGGTCQPLGARQPARTEPVAELPRACGNLVRRGFSFSSGVQEADSCLDGDSGGAECLRGWWKREEPLPAIPRLMPGMSVVWGSLAKGVRLRVVMKIKTGPGGGGL